MIKFFDYFFLKLFRFVLRLKKDKEGAKWSALLYFSAYMAISWISIVCLLGMSVDNVLSQVLVSNPLIFWMLSFVLSPFLLSLRYYRHINISEIEISYDSMGVKKQRLINALIYFLIPIIPILTFFLYRIYVFGHI